MKDVIKSVILEWMDKDLSGLIERNIDIPVDVPMVISIIGARRSGKTYILYEVLKKLKESGFNKNKIIYLNFEDERLDLSARDLDLILQSYRELFPENKLSECYFFFDEIQNVTGWEKFVRRIFDNYSRHIYITGSNSKLLGTEIATSLRGRTITYEVYPLSLKEYLKFKNVKPDLYQAANKSKIVHHSLNFIKNGSFPELVDFPDKLRIKSLQAYFNTMIFRDIIERYKISDPNILKFFIKKVYAGIGKNLSINKIYRDLKSMGYKISNNYLYNYEEYIYTTFMGIGVKKYHASEIKQEKSDKKLYSIDTGLVSAVEYSISENRGKLLENAVALELIRLEFEIFYYKDRYECDFIAERDHKLTAIQVCWHFGRDGTLERELRGLYHACEDFGIKEGIVITFDDKGEYEYKGRKFKSIPFYEYFLNV